MPREEREWALPKRARAHGRAENVRVDRASSWQQVHRVDDAVEQEPERGGRRAVVAPQVGARPIDRRAAACRRETVRPPSNTGFRLPPPAPPPPPVFPDAAPPLPP